MILTYFLKFIEGVCMLENMEGGWRGGWRAEGKKISSQLHDLVSLRS